MLSHHIITLIKPINFYIGKVGNKIKRAAFTIITRCVKVEVFSISRIPMTPAIFLFICLKYISSQDIFLPGINYKHYKQISGPNTQCYRSIFKCFYMESCILHYYTLPQIKEDF